MSPNHGNRFSGLVWLEDQEDGTHAKLLAPLEYLTEDGWRIAVPAGFITDFASIPRVLWSLIPPRGRYNRPAIIHDYLYHYAPVDSTTGARVTKGRADAILREGCKNVDDRLTQRWTIWLGLRLGGFVAWNNYRKHDEVTT